MSTDPKVTAYYAAAEAAVPAPLTPAEKVAKVERLKAHLANVKNQFVEEGMKLKKAKASKDAGAQKGAESVLQDNLTLRRKLVLELRSLGERADDPLSD